MKRSIGTKVAVLFLATILVLSGLVISGHGSITAKASQSWIISVKWSGWTSPKVTLMNGWKHASSSKWCVHANSDYSAVCYCIEPGASSTSWTDSYATHDENWWDANLSTNSFNKTINGKQIKVLLGRIMQYGYTGSTSQSWASAPSTYKDKICKYIATQLLVWEVIVGERDADFNHVSASGCDEVLDILGDHPWKTSIMTYYQSIAASVLKHQGLPSFMEENVKDAQTVDLTWNGSKYTATLTNTNTNCDLSSFTFTASSSNVTCSVSGNTLTLSASSLSSSEVTITAVKNVSRKGLIVWYNDDYQNKVSYTNAVTETLYGYVKAAGSDSRLKIIKTSDYSGAGSFGFLIGWQFTIYTDSACTKAIGTYISGSDGTITTNLNPGVYYVKETGASSRVDTSLWIMDTSIQKVTVKAGQTSEVTFKNLYQERGEFTIIKKTGGGGTVEGWQFTVYSDAECTEETGTYTSGSDGTITAELPTGTYYVRETGCADSIDDSYWTMDDRVQEVHIVSGQISSVTFENQYHGKAKIIKTLSHDGVEAPYDSLLDWTLQGWIFQIRDADGSELGTYETDETGTILTDLEPGTYYVSEIIDEGSSWYCTGELTQEITVIAGQTAEISFVNAPLPGKVTIHKVDSSGVSLPGAVFLLEYSVDGETWLPVWYNNESTPGSLSFSHIGGCSSADLADGCLTTDENGNIVFEDLWPTLLYRLTEVEAPDGYQLLTGSIEFTLATGEDFEVGYEITDAAMPILPAAGTSGFWFLPASTAVFLICMNRMICGLAGMRKKGTGKK